MSADTTIVMIVPMKELIGRTRSSNVWLILIFVKSYSLKWSLSVRSSTIGFPPVGNS